MAFRPRPRPRPRSRAPVLPVLPVLPTGGDRYRQVATGSMASDKCRPEWRGHSCLRASTRADRNVCPTLSRSIAAASRDGVAPPVLARLCGSTPNTRPPSTTATPGDPRRGWLSTVPTSYDKRGLLSTGRHCLLPTAYCPCLLLLPHPSCLPDFLI